MFSYLFSLMAPKLSLTFFFRIPFDSFLFESGTNMSEAWWVVAAVFLIDDKLVWEKWF